MKKISNIVFFFLLTFFSSISVAMDDPTRPPFSILTSREVQPLILTAIFTYPNGKMAIVNGRSVKIGDRIEEFTVTSITAYNVELIGPLHNKETLWLVTPIKQKDDTHRD